MTATIRDVARRARVAVSTVSRVLNDSGYVSAETRERVEKAIRDLDFRPNMLARGLISRQSYIIGLVLPDLSNPFFSPIATGVEAVAKAAGYSVIICNAEQSAEQAGEWVRHLRGNWIDGILFAMEPRPTDLQGLVQDRIPVVLVDQEVAGVDVDRVLVNHRAGALQAVRHLVELGHRRIAHVTGPRQGASVRLEGYLQALQEAGIHPDQALISAPGDFSADHGYEVTRALLELPRARRPTAVFCVNDLAAVGCLRAAEAAGVQVPGELSVVGYDDIVWAQLIRPALTTVAQPVADLGRLTTQLLVDRISHQAANPPERICLDARLVVRSSSAPPQTLAGP